MDFKAVFGEPGEHDDKVAAYLADLRQNWRDAEATISKAMFVLVLLAVSFVLIANRGLAEVDVFGLTITNLPLVQAAIPVVAAYMYFMLALNVGVAWRLQTVHDSLYKYSWSAFYHQDLEVTLRPSGSFAASELLKDTTRPRALLDMGLTSVGVVRTVTYLAAPLGFIGYAVLTLWHQVGMPHVMAAVATALSGVFTLACLPLVAYIAGKFRDDFIG